MERTAIDRLLEDARQKLERLDPLAAAAAIRAGATLIDIRAESQIAADGGVPGAIVIPRNVLEWRLDPESGHSHPLAPGLDAHVIVMCNEGYQSSLAAATLQQLGFARATDLDGGFQAWREAGLPVKRPGGPAGRQSASAPTAVPDFEALRSCWHPVGFADAFGDQPRRVRLLGEELVVWRDAAGVAHALRDLCIHRGTALSLGRVVDGELMCPYHGWRYAADGRCTHIPQLADPTRVPGKARVDAFACLERHRLLWVALSSPRWDPPELRELSDPGWTVVQAGPYTWNADASRQLENFTDFGHFPWVHPGLLGDPSRPVVPRHTVHPDGHVLRYEIVRPEAGNTDEFPVFDNRSQSPAERHSHYELHLPYTIVIRLGWEGASGMVYLFSSQPIDDEHCCGYVVIARNYNHDQPASVLREFEDTIFEQDRRVVESQRPERVSFDLADELHLKFDAVAVAYRRAMRTEGLATSP